VTAVPIVRVALVSGHALAAAFVIVRHAHGIERAREPGAHRRAFEHAQRVRFARFRVAAVRVGRTIGQRRLFALGHDRIPREPIATRTHGRPVLSRQTNLVRPARHTGARAHARGQPARHGGAYFAGRVAVVVRPAFALRWRDSLQLASQIQVAGVPEISLGANARRTVTLRHANRVRPAL